MHSGLRDERDVPTCVPELWLSVLVLGEKSVYQEKGSQRANNNVMVALSGRCSSHSIFFVCRFQSSAHR